MGALSACLPAPGDVLWSTQRAKVAEWTTAKHLDHSHQRVSVNLPRNAHIGFQFGGGGGLGSGAKENFSRL